MVSEPDPRCNPHTALEKRPDQEYSVSYSELDTLIRESPDKKAKQYLGMTAENWRDVISRLYRSSQKLTATEISPDVLLDRPVRVTSFFVFHPLDIICFREVEGKYKLFLFRDSSLFNTDTARRFAADGEAAVAYLKASVAKDKKWYDRVCSDFDVRFFLSALEREALYDMPRQSAPFVPEYSLKRYFADPASQICYVSDGKRYYCAPSDFDQASHFLKFIDSISKAAFRLIGGVRLKSAVPGSEPVEKSNTESVDKPSLEKPRREETRQAPPARTEDKRRPAAPMSQAQLWTYLSGSIPQINLRASSEVIVNSQRQSADELLELIRKNKFYVHSGSACFMVTDHFSAEELKALADQWRISYPRCPMRIVYLAGIGEEDAVSSVFTGRGEAVLARWYAPLERKTYVTVIECRGYSHDGSEDRYCLSTHVDDAT